MNEWLAYFFAGHAILPDSARSSEPKRFDRIGVGFEMIDKF
jgi:hypothetical protein